MSDITPLRYKLLCATSAAPCRPALLLLFAAALTPCLAQGNASAVAAPQSFALADTSSLSVIGGKAEPFEYLGRKAVRLTTTAESDIFAFVNGSAIQV